MLSTKLNEKYVHYFKVPCIIQWLVSSDARIRNIELNIFERRKRTVFAGRFQIDDWLHVNYLC